MNRNFLTLALALACTAAVAGNADTRTDPAAPPAADLQPALPPPGMDEPGVKTAVADPVADKAAKRDALGRAAPDVTIRTEGDDTIEEYRTDGKVSMIRITRKGGVAQTYLDTDGDGRLEGNPKDGPVAPVYYKIYEWN